MGYPPLVKYETEQQYKEHFVKKYCDKEKPIFTYDGMKINFYEDKFEHAFFESKSRKKKDKAIFSIKRAERIDWIEAVLKDKDAELYFGWDYRNKTIDMDSRVSIINQDNYVVVLHIKSETEAKFITAYLADSPNTAKKIRNMPKWINKKATDSGSAAETSIHPKL